MFKSYAGEKIMPIMKKNKVGFVSAESSVFAYCLLLLDLSLVMSAGAPV